MMLRPFFSFYGSKWQIAKRYPTPEHGTIIEPFAGSAGYSLRYPDRMVKLIDIDPRVVGVWSYLIATPSWEIARLPLLEPSQSVDDLNICQEARWLIGFWLNKASTMPKKSASAWMRKERYKNQFWGERIRERVASQVDSIRHWEVAHGSYADIPAQEATWFIDPPYQAKGKYYSCSLESSCFPLLAQWCRSLPGQVIACEQDGANWLPFAHLVDAKATTKSAGASQTSKEVIWTSHSPQRRTTPCRCNM
ncbi:hypothetical protein CMI37_28100 [Candidatus Pacearchaeota archaeon]|nr:hypothetical protein [Candidatus Pacearchaeota archaeon]